MNFFIKMDSLISVKLLGVEIDNKLSFKNHINIICKKANQKLNALARVSSYMDFPKKKILFNAFFDCQFAYSPLAWMIHHRDSNHKINRVHEKCLRVIFNDKNSTFQELLEKNHSVCIHHKNLQTLCIEMFKVKNENSPVIFSNIFDIKDPPHYNLRNK